MLRPIFFLIGIAFALNNSVTLGSAIVCHDDDPRGLDAVIVVNDKLFTSEKGVYIERTDVSNRYPQLLGLYSRQAGTNSVSFTFAEAGEVDWSTVDKSRCWTSRDSYVMVSDLALNNNKDTKGKYVGRYLLAPRIAIRPGHEKTCPIPKVKVGPSKPIHCDDVNGP